MTQDHSQDGYSLHRVQSIEPVPHSILTVEKQMWFSPVIGFSMMIKVLIIVSCVLRKGGYTRCPSHVSTVLWLCRFRKGESLITLYYISDSLPFHTSVCRTYASASPVQETELIGSDRVFRMLLTPPSCLLRQKQQCIRFCYALPFKQ